MKDNLLTPWYNAVITVVLTVVIFVVLRAILRWALYEATWDVVLVNLRLFAVGPYPEEAFWRIWMSLGVVSLLAGLSWGVWGGRNLTPSAIVGVLGAVLLVLPVSSNVKWPMVGILALFILAHLASMGRTGFRRPLVWGWVLSFFVILFLLKGLGGSTLLTSVPTSKWGGLLLTVLLAIVAIVASFPLGVLLALGRRSELPVVKLFSILYIESVRGVPLVTVLWASAIILPLFFPKGVRVDNLIRAMVGMTLFSAAYLAENVRGGLQGVPRGQYEAAYALGLNYYQAMRYIILPQALRAVIPAIVGQFIGLFKDTTLVAIVGLLDLLGIALSVIAQPEFIGLQREVFVFIAAIYWIFTYAMSYSSRRLEARLGVGTR
ncbi:MAG: amino acid ABC transporter permease [Ardenticatenia bacterium]|nr:amino acid ABC transporter permease [Ardenticatenia bacterium]